MRKKTAAGLLVVVELGGEWPARLEAAAATTRRVLAQLEGETPEHLAARVAKSLDGLFDHGVRISTLALACNERIDAAALDARRQIAGLALGRMSKQQSGKVYLTAAGRASGRLHHALSALAGDLAQEWHSSGLEISVGLGDEGRSSPVASSPPARAAVA